MHGITKPPEIVEAEKWRGFFSMLAFAEHDWEADLDNYLEAMVYISRNSSDGVTHLMDWPHWLILKVHEQVSRLIQRENDANKPSG